MNTRTRSSSARVCRSLMLFFGALSQIAFADPKVDDSLEACASAAERGQAARHAGKLLRARDELRICGAEICPGIVQEDCLRWLSEIDQELPSVLFRARDARGRDVIGVRVYANGDLLADDLDGRAVALDPGRYDLRYQARSGAIKNETVLLRLGERRRELSVRFSEALEPNGSVSPPKTASPAVSVRPQTTVHPPARRDQRGTRSTTLGYVFGSAALATFGAFAYFELKGQAQYRELKAGCGRTQSCPEDQVGAARTDFVLAGSFLAASVVCLGLSTWQFLRSPQSPSSAGFVPRPARSAADTNILWRF